MLRASQSDPSPAPHSTIHSRSILTLASHFGFLGAIPTLPSKRYANSTVFDSIADLLEGTVDAMLFESTGFTGGYLHPNMSSFIVTQPMYDGYGAIANLKTTASTNDWALFHPFDSSLWVATVLVTLVTAALMVAIDSIIHVNDADDRKVTSAAVLDVGDDAAAVGADDDKGTAAAALYGFISNYLVSLYHAGAMLLGGEDYVS